MKQKNSPKKFFVGYSYCKLFRGKVAYGLPNKYSNFFFENKLRKFHVTINLIYLTMFEIFTWKLYRILMTQISDFQIAITHHQMALESRKKHHSTQNKKTSSNCILRFFRKKSTFPLCFHFTILKSVIYITIHYLTISFSFCQGLPRKTAEMSVYKVVRSLILE